MQITFYDPKDEKTYTVSYLPTCIWLSNEEGKGMGLNEEVIKKFCDSIYNAIDVFFKEHY